ncbi:F0F1 ATP synthase subunit B [Vibrio sp. S4M6]|uniref:F0F1 ATP synthase subunit B n=1 Tax=Vibrio sinus TaxID=2946865 RepID=UPI002029D59C|nr:F0F1 ATP synthase subunit B [Vibrio sinus]MCL9782631.1 F0F1 ATP synthase subunit B [Vibrio sinus]
MNLNATMLGQALSFVIFVWLCMRYVWPPLSQMLDERQKEVAEGIRNTEMAAKELALAKENGSYLIDEAKKDVSKMIAQGQKRREQIIEEAIQEAEKEKARIIAQGEAEVESEKNRVRQELKDEMADLVINSAQKLINKNLDTDSNRALVDQLIKEI